jgi:small GTP-binding protein
MISANNDLLQKIADKGRKFSVESIHESERCISTAFSLHQAEDSIFEMSSTIDSRHFDFDDQITNAQAYRRALASLRQKDHLLGAVQTSETWETVPRHKVETTQALQANSEPEITTQNSERHAAGLKRSISLVTSLVETGKRPNFTESIERIVDASGNTLENNLVADLSTEERSESHVLGEYLLQIYGATKRVPTEKNTIGSCSSRTLTVDSNITVGDGLQTSEDVRKLKFVMLGDSYSGKTYAMMKYMRGDTYGIPSAPTVGEEYTSDLWVDGRQYQIQWIDTPGQENYDSVRTLAYAGCHVAILVFAIDSPDSFANIKEKWAREIFQHQPLIPKILVGCKSDLRSHSNTIEKLANISQKLVAKEDAEAFASCLGYDIKDLCTQAICNVQMKYMECSAFTGEGIVELFEEAARLAVISSINRFTIDAALMLTNKKRKRLSDLFRRSQAREIDVRQV